MKKQLLILLAVAMTLAGCQKKINLKAESEALYNRSMAVLDGPVTQAEREAALMNLIDSTYLLLEQYINEPYGDSLFAGMYYLFSPEQKQTLFGLMTPQLRESEMIAPIYSHFLLETATSSGNPYTDFIGLTPEGDELALNELVGKTDYVLVDFWASWCNPCRRLIPVLKEIYAGQPKGKLQILSCSVDRDEKAWRQALKEEQMPWPQVREIEDAYECSDLYGVSAIPTTILIDKEGTIIARNPDEAELEKILFN